MGRAVEFVLEGLEDPAMTPDFEQGYDVRNWGHVYALQLLARMRELGRTPMESAARGTSRALKKCFEAAVRRGGLGPRSRTGRESSIRGGSEDESPWSSRRAAARMTSSTPC